jgi:hypothetical protein
MRISLSLSTLEVGCSPDRHPPTAIFLDTPIYVIIPARLRSKTGPEPHERSVQRSSPPVLPACGIAGTQPVAMTFNSRTDVHTRVEVEEMIHRGTNMQTWNPLKPTEVLWGGARCGAKAGMPCEQEDDS